MTFFYRAKGFKLSLRFYLDWLKLELKLISLADLILIGFVILFFGSLTIAIRMALNLF